ncbi:30S ribosomal protein S7 [archaeon]|nr:30S ribosomal protein S7 [archaeon]MBT4023175.1 30S ribosomal protein S7 [archaeon]MBT4272381.1 30S ribosomal protein S7 [archaeon]MBT4460710.1 30S ribosomal protein S7 [archaeon]MBT4859142.1 30S ribosomal protein S7 [archaeon]
MKVFNRWSVEGISVHDKGLKKYISLKPKMVPKTGAKYAGSRFHKSKIFVVERLINRLMVSGHKSKKHLISSGRNTGKAHSVYDMVENAFLKIEKTLNKNPIEVFVQAIENAAPREEIITIEYGGARYPKAVEVAPQRRIDMALKYMVQGIYQKSFNKKKSAVDNIADEIMHAYNLSTNSVAVAKKLELERQADSSR